MKKALFIFFFLAAMASADAATISGTAYEWYSLEPLSDVIIDVNTMPNQTVVANDGTYSIDISENGAYLIRAQYFENNLLKYQAEELIDVKQEGAFRVDLIMFPYLEDDETLFEQLGDLNMQVVAEPETEPSPDLTLLYLALIAVAGIAFYLFITRKKPQAHVQVPPQRNPERSSTQKELDEVLGIIKNYGGRITQLELREKLPYSEAKVSLIVAELEHMGKIKKFKKGRGNIIVLKD